MAEGVRILLCTLVIFAVGIALGFRFTQGLLAAIALFAIPVLYGLGFATMVTALAVYTAKAALVEVVSLGSSLLMFFSTGFVPLAAYPGWARPIVEHNPLTPPSTPCVDSRSVGRCAIPCWPPWRGRSARSRSSPCLPRSVSAGPAATEPTPTG